MSDEVVVLDAGAHRAYLMCHKRLWLEANRPELVAPTDYSARSFAAKDDVAAHIHRYMIGWFEVPRHLPHGDRLVVTAKAMKHLDAGDIGTIYDAVFEEDRIRVNVDALAADALGDGYEMLFIKSGTKYKPKSHLAPIGFAYYFLTKIKGMNIKRVTLAHVNRDYVAGGDAGFVKRVDITSEAMIAAGDVSYEIKEMRGVIGRDDCPDVGVGKKCKSSQFVCPLYDHCWSGVDGMTIYDIPHLSGKRLLGLESNDILMLEDVPLDALTAKQGAFVRWILDKEINIDVQAIETAMADIQYPIYFLDFETIDHAVPVWDGVRPHQAVPFQYSVHALHEDGRLEHSSYLHTDSSDPRHSLATKLVDDIGETGTVVAYHIGFERGVLFGLAEHVPAVGGYLRYIADRLWDQLPIFQKHYRDYRFGRSNGLKSVLPVVCPHLSYGDLAVKDGLAAQIAFEKMIASDNAGEKADIAFALLAYCDLDTLAMVEIHKVLIAL